MPRKNSGVRKKPLKNTETIKRQCVSGSNSKIESVQSLAVVVLATLFAFFNSYHESTMFENDRHFSHLSSLEREMTFRTEMGLYYSYFKSVVEAPSLWTGIHQIMNDNLTEYPSTINTLERFNLYPEVLLAMGYRSFESIASYLQVHTKECWKVLRGDGLPAIESCEGLGDPAYFYTTSVFLLNGLVGSLMFLYGKFLSDSVFGGILSAICFFFNHGECTRVQWTPPLRESFGYPMFLLQMFLVTIIITRSATKWTQVLILGVISSLFMLFWQFAQFALLTQTLAVFITYILNFMPTMTLQCVLKGQLVGLFIAAVLLFGNKMLLTSFYTSTLIIIYVISMMEKYFKKINWNLFMWIAQLLFLVLGSIVLKTTLSFALNVSDDAHIWNILKSKFTSYQDFHTMLYTCAVEFNFLELETYIRLTKTLVLPLGVIVLIAIFTQLYWKKRKLKVPVTYEDANVIYNLLQMLAFFIMAVLFMRLKLFFTPHLCLIASLATSERYFSFLSKPLVKYSAMVLLLSLMAVQGIQNIQYQRSILGEFSNPDLEELINWVNSSTTPDAVFAGPMPTMANLMLSTRRPIVNHPHYESAALRERTYQVYKIFSRRSATEVHNILLKMRVDFVVVERTWCFEKSRDGCSMADLWDMEDKKNLGKEPLCQILIRNPAPFQKAFQNSIYTVFAL